MRPNEHYNMLTNYFVEVDDIYGNSPSPSFPEWRPINKHKFTLGEIKIEEGELVFYGPGHYVGKTAEYIRLAIKTNNLTEDIDKIILTLYIPLNVVIQQLYDECEKDSKLIGHISNKYTSHNELFNALASYFQRICLIPVIYGKDIKSGELRQITKDEFSRMYFDDEGSSLYYHSDKRKKYTDLYIKRENYWEAIEGVKEELKKMKMD